MVPKKIWYFDNNYNSSGSDIMNQPKTTILIADDEIRITQLIKDFLAASGYNTLIATDGEEALTLFNGHPEISLIILDIMIPEKDGWQVWTWSFHS